MLFDSRVPIVEFPVEDPILIFGLAMVVFLVAPIVLEQYKLPGIIGIILVGAIVGPNGVGVLDRDATFVLLGEVGIVYLMFLAGLEIHFHRFLEYKDRSIVFGTLSFLIPQGVGTIVGISILGLSVPAALLFAAIFSSHTLLAYPVANRLGLVHNEAITATVGGTILTDTLALLVLAIVIAWAGGALDASFWLRLGVGLTMFLLLVWVLVPWIARWFFRSIDQESYFDFLFVMAVLFMCAYVAELIGIKHIVGAFLAGLALNRLIPKSGPLMNRIEFVGNALFIPFFLISIGMLVDVWVLFEGTTTGIITATMLASVIVTKYAASWLTGEIYGYTHAEILGMYGLSMGQAAAALAIVLIGFEEGIPGFDRHMINGVILMILVVSLLSPSLVGRAGADIRRMATDQVHSVSDAPERILIPFSRESNHSDELLHFALLLRGSRSDEPLYAVSVVTPGARAESEVALVERALSDVETAAAGAEVSVESRVNVDQNTASGILDTVVENRITTLVIGWDGARSRRQSVFGSVIDQVIRRTDRTVVVTRARKPVETTRRIVVILPPSIEHNRGVAQVIDLITRIADETGAFVIALAVDGDSVRCRDLFETIGPEVPVEVAAVPDWGDVSHFLAESVREDDLVVCVSARRGTIGWDDELTTLPKQISTLVEGNFAVMYPPDRTRADDRLFLRLQ